ncbi:sensor histidine kinase [Micromonospora sp. NPDC093277]|uniref:sensor histidine kinase n=1 Tax=Micromonospora sp. NPDC093277 TaxID=3364291 RepID=UPI00380E2CC0
MHGLDRRGVAAAGAGVVSIAADAAVLAWGRPYSEGMTLANMLALVETVVLLALTVLVVRGSRAPVAIVAGTLTGLAVPLWLLRFGIPTWSTQSVGGYAAWAMLPVLAVVVGLYLRALDKRGTRAVAAARRVQRLELADDLHDFVVHDINEMLLQAQAGQVLVEGAVAGAGVGDVLRRIERTALRALRTVDRTVHLLHAEAASESDANSVPRLPKPTMDDLPGLVDRFTATGPITAHLALDPELAPATGASPVLPPEVATTVYRIVVEALTNVRRHATGAERVQVTVARTTGDRVRVEISDNGGLAGRVPAGPGRGGHGLAGLAARVEALGGTLSTGPAESVGWRVTAALPLHPRPAAAPIGQ